MGVLYEFPHVEIIERKINLRFEFALEVFIGVLEPLQMEYEDIGCGVYLHGLICLTFDDDMMLKYT